jgi:predicted nucleotidyltransferase
MDIQTIRQKTLPIFKQYRVRKAAVFGSVARGDALPDSDLDILIDPPQSMSLLDFVALKQDIEDIVHMPVDLVSYRGLSPYLKDSILSCEHVFYETN